MDNPSKKKPVVNLKKPLLLHAIVIMVCVLLVVGIKNSYILTGRSYPETINVNQLNQKAVTSSLLLEANSTPLERALDYLRSVQQSDGCISDFATSSWAVMAIAAAGEDPHEWKLDSGPSIVDYLIENRDMLNPVSYTHLTLPTKA